jgi:hypothetical protein
VICYLFKDRHGAAAEQLAAGSWQLAGNLGSLPTDYSYIRDNWPNDTWAKRRFRNENMSSDKVLKGDKIQILDSRNL